MRDPRDVWWVRVAVRLVPFRYRSEVLDDLCDDHAGNLRAGRSRLSADLAFALDLIWSAVDCRRLTAVPVRFRPWRGTASDIVYAWRRVRRAPGVSAIAVATLALGIGSTAAIFGLVNAVLLKTAAIFDIDRVVAARYAESPSTRPGVLAYLDYQALSTSAAHVFSGVAAVLNHPSSHSANGAGQSEPVQTEFVSSQYFQVLGQRPLVGTLEFPGNELEPGTSVILGEAAWRRWFNGDRAAIGRTISVSRVPLTIIGIVPEAFTGVRMPTIRRTDLWLPLGMAGSLTKPPMRLPWENPKAATVMVFGRLRDGIDQAQARRALATVERRFPKENASGPPYSLTPASEVLVPAAFRRAFGAAGVGLTILAVLVLVIACANLANLLLAQSVGRRHEWAVRLATGASRWRLVRLALVEATLLAGVALVVGLAAGGAVSQLLSSIALPPFDGRSVYINASLDWRVVFFSAGLAALAALVVGAGPAWLAARSRAGVLTNHAVDVAVSGRRLRAFVVSGQVAACTVLLIVAGLYVRGAVAALSHDPGFDSTHVAMARLDLGASGSDQTQGEAFLARAIAEVGRMPGVRHAAVADVFPLGAVNDGVAILAAVETGDSVKLTGKFARVSPAFFDALRIPIMRGRSFTTTDAPGAPLVAIVSEYAARRLWPNEDPIGKRIAVGNAKQWQEVVGVARDTDVAEPGRQGAMVYVPFAQRDMPRPILLAAGPGRADALVTPLREVLRSIDPDIAVMAAGTVADDLSVITLPVRAVAAVVSVLGTIGLLLALVGLYGTVTFTVRARTREIGIRMALGARASEVRRLVLRQTMAILVGGVIPGLLLAAGGAAFVRRLFLGVETRDPITFIAIPVLLILVGVAATYLPGRRAARIDPTIALRDL